MALNPEGWWKLAGGKRSAATGFAFPRCSLPRRGNGQKIRCSISAQHPLHRPSRAEFIARVPGGCAALATG